VDFSSKKNRKTNVFEGVITYKHYQIRKHPWKKGLDSVYSWFVPKSVLYVGKNGTIYVSGNETTLFLTEEDKEYRIHTYKNKIHCSEKNHRNYYYNPVSFKISDSTRVILGRRSKTGVYAEDWGRGNRRLTYFYIDNKIKLDTSNSLKENRRRDALLKSHPLLSRQEFGEGSWVVQEAVEIKEMNTDEIFAGYKKIIDNDHWIGWHRKYARQKAMQKIVFISVIILLLGVPLLYMRKSKYGIVAYFISLGVLALCITSLWLNRIENVAAHKKMGWRGLGTGFNEGIKFFFASATCMILFLVFTIAWTLIMKKAKKKKEFNEIENN